MSDSEATVPISDCGRPMFEVVTPARQLEPFVFNSPHSGRLYSEAFLSSSRLDRNAIRRSEDFFVDRLFAAVTELGAPLLKAHFPRAWLDVNREPYELDPRMFDAPLPVYANVGSLRVAGGLGTIPRLVAENVDIYRERLSVDEGLARIEQVYRPYHACLRRLIAQTHVRFGIAVLIDCHSMPAGLKAGSASGRPDFIIGDRYGSSAAHDLSRAAVAILTGLGYEVARNKPYAGGFITEHYGRPARGLHTLQIEINRGLYIDESTLQPKAGFRQLQNDLTHFVAELMAFVRDEMGNNVLAAE